MDFTINTYKVLLQALLAADYSFLTFEQFITDPLNKVVILRHDVDKLPRNALKMARLEREMGVVSTYYFRAGPVSFDPQVMEEITGMGHEIGYHYENVDAVQHTARAEGHGQRAKGKISSEYLARLRAKAPDVIINQSQFIIKKDLLDVAPLGVLNRHNALLPKNRLKMFCAPGSKCVTWGQRPCRCTSGRLIFICPGGVISGRCGGIVKRWGW